MQKGCQARDTAIALIKETISFHDGRQSRSSCSGLSQISVQDSLSALLQIEAAENSRRDPLLLVN